MADVLTQVHPVILPKRQHSNELCVRDDVSSDTSEPNLDDVITLDLTETNEAPATTATATSDAEGDDVTAEVCERMVELKLEQVSDDGSGEKAEVKSADDSNGERVRLFITVYTDNS